MASKNGPSKYFPISSQDSNSSSENLSESQGFLPNSEKEQYHPERSGRRRRLVDIAAAILATLLVTISLQVAYAKIFPIPRHVFEEAIAKIYGEEARQSPQYDCGNNSTTAVSQGCIFDISVLGWVPSQCYDGFLHQRFLDFGWRYFEDEAGTIEVPLERVAASAGTREPFWVQHGFHVTHCELAWQRMHRAVKSGGRLTTHLLNFDHTHHCGGIIEMRDDLQQINSQILPLLNSC